MIYRLGLLIGLLLNLSVCNAIEKTGSTTMRSGGNIRLSCLTKNKQYEIDAYVPDFKLKGEDGKTYSLSALRGKWIVLYFWTQKSKWSVSGLNIMADVQETYGDTLQTFCLECYKQPVNKQPDVGLDDKPIQMVMCCCSVESSLFRYFNVQGFPTRILISPKGKVVEVIAGAGCDEFPKSRNKYMDRLRIRVR